MEKMAKIFRNGSNQAVRLPVQFQFNTDRVYIRKNDKGDVILSKNKFYRNDWTEFLNILNQISLSDDFLDSKERKQDLTKRDPFSEIN
ncbi:AbrB/MazE/SpoVT family DNA-binding domain-containing protein (plasmid) [Arsenophonus sp. aPb]|uniref:antitoxin n=1 Tax=Arsenophonus sp. aPb TaxID=3041619 RepID=UPI002469B358|nr:AbrB/MazE/SpoVT family DNA-binding domain-containing protein [Arsenophonus sp. aPb]WGL99960.1 AbrB/MazE/SpoVT family DNA-binding domain-containing protein [Arsenophonus sp. aPb]